MAYAFLEANVRFQYEFFDNTEWFLFRDSSGHETPVRSFGIRKSEAKDGLNTFRAQVNVLFRNEDQFALDLSKESQPQIIAACIPRKESLQAMVAEVQSRQGPAIRLGENATLLVPNMEWTIEQHFHDLEDKDFKNPAFLGYYLYQALQLIQFKLSRKGAELKSDTYIASDDGHPEDKDPNVYHFNRPFLLYMKKREAAQPFFVMWVDNAELLSKH